MFFNHTDYIYCFISSILFFISTYILYIFFFFFFNDTATTEIYTLSLHDALPIRGGARPRPGCSPSRWWCSPRRSEEHTSELQSRVDVVCRLLLEKKKKKISRHLSLKTKISNQQKNTTKRND